MTDRLRNISHSNWNYFGDVRVGLPADECSGLLTDAVAAFPGALLRYFSPAIPPGTVINEDGSYTGTEPDEYTIYVDGASVGQFGAELPPRGVAGRLWWASCGW